MSNQDIAAQRVERTVLDTREMQWQTSPSPGVWRKRLHHVGPAEAGQVTSLVRFDPGTNFPAHDHPDGEEILVLEGTFSDEQGDWGAGSYLLNPEGFRHAPFSHEGCVLFVKLRQYAGSERAHLAVAVDEVPWGTDPEAGIERKILYEQAGFPDVTRLERWSGGGDGQVRKYPGGAEIFVLEGGFADESGTYEEGAWLLLPEGFQHRPSSATGCVLYVKTGGVGQLWSAAPGSGASAEQEPGHA